MSITIDEIERKLIEALEKEKPDLSIDYGGVRFCRDFIESNNLCIVDVEAAMRRLTGKSVAGYNFIQEQTRHPVPVSEEYKNKHWAKKHLHVDVLNCVNSGR
jgi:hypothetical protein